MAKYNISGMYAILGDVPKPFEAGAKKGVEEGSVSEENLEDILFSIDAMMQQIPFTTQNDLPLQVAISLGKDYQENSIVREVFIQPSEGDTIPGLESQVKGITKPFEVMGLKQSANWKPDAIEDEVTDLYAIYTQGGTKYVIAANPFKYELLGDDGFERDMLFRTLACLEVKTDNGRYVSAYWLDEGDSDVQIHPDLSRVIKISQYGCTQLQFDGDSVQVDVFGTKCLVDIETPDNLYDDYDVVRGVAFGNRLTEEKNKDLLNMVLGQFNDLPFDFLEDEDNRWSIEYRTRMDDEGEYVSHMRVRPSSVVEVEDDIGLMRDVKLETSVDHLYKSPGILRFRHGETLYVIEVVKLVGKTDDQKDSDENAEKEALYNFLAQKKP